MIVTHLGHACLLVETGGARLLIDPGVFTQGFEELADLDAVLVTHQHPDHLDVERLPALLESNPQAQLLAEPEAGSELDKAGLTATHLHPGETVTFGAAGVTGAGGVHAEIDPAIPLVGNVGLLVSAPEEPTLFHPGDSYAYTPEGVDVLAVPLNAPWAKFSETVSFVRGFGDVKAFPVHDGLLKPPGRGVYLTNLGKVLPELELLDLGAAGPTTF